VSRNRDRRPTVDTPPSQGRNSTTASEPQTLHIRSETSVFVGPLPPPEQLARYEDVYPGCARQIVELAQHQATHRQTLERTHLERSFNHQRLGSTFGFVLGLGGLVGGIFLVATGHAASGLTMFFSTVTTLVGTFVYGKERTIGERRQQREELAKVPTHPPVP
jgi:uncharacterized membrane protein